MKNGFRQSMAWLHTWTGLLLGWLLFAIFVTGTSSYFQEEITAWMTPEVRSVPADGPKSFAAATRWLEREAPGASEWSVYSAGKRAAGLQLYWVNGPDAPADAPTDARLDGGGRKAEARETRGGEFLYRFHYDLHYINWYWARWIVGIAAMAMLVAIFSGIVTHKKIIADFFLLRLGKGQRSWLDAHNVSSVLFLPFILMITYTGLVSLATHYMPWGIAANYADQQKFFDTTFPWPTPAEKVGPAPLTAVAPLVERAERTWGAGAGSVRILNPGDRTAQVIVSTAPDAGMSVRPRSLTFDGVTGKLISAHNPSGASTATEGTMIGLHAGRFASGVLRTLYFLSGLAGCIMVASGLILWTVKRRAKLADPDRPHFGFRLVEKLNVGAIAGLPFAIAAYFLANRLLPVGGAGRSDREIAAFFIAWGAVFVWATARPSARAWVEALAAVAVSFALVPVINALTTDRSLVASLIADDWVFAGFDATMLLIAAGFGWAASKVLRRSAGPRTARGKRPARSPSVEVA
ncbi:PepSY-associated TM helix domain-containing protein [Sphingopyxis fribergensis]|uniref:PepSY-associated TM helix domain-containing protein n=1 Tax=Sphingopyxis fribergensis TaxID=1515612 RepID=A0A0A7PII4_9SPHN|nr:PepSY-associated TM helix domain-containing protein [Sphingopyxis fribergensis]AJA07712.1 PepSY-associated TM helix domain-containing protein [Sphingopyxis fribergensis]